MPRDLTAAEIGRMHALQRAAEAVQGFADAWIAAMAHEGLDDADRAYLTAASATARSIADRLRNSPGYQP